MTRCPDCDCNTSYGECMCRTPEQVAEMEHRLEQLEARAAKLHEALSRLVSAIRTDHVFVAMSMAAEVLAEESKARG